VIKWNKIENLLGGLIMEFQFLVPVKIVFGQGKIKETGNLCKSLGTRAVIVTGKNSAKKSSALDRLLESLETENISAVVYDQVVGEPDVIAVDRGVTFLKEEACNRNNGSGSSPLSHMIIYSKTCQ